jgi:hypothetical protein
MTINWLATTALALLIGTGAVIAQSQPDMPKREEGPRAQTPSLPSKDADRPAGEQRPDRLKDRAAQPEPKAGKEPRRGEAAAPTERKQAQEPRDNQPTKQSQGEPGRGERASPTQQGQEQQKERDARQKGEAKQQAEPKRQQGRDAQPKQDQARDAKQPSDSKQQQGQQQPQRDRTDRAAEPSATSPSRQDARSGDTGETRQQGRKAGEAADQSRRGGPAAADDRQRTQAADDRQRTQIIERLRRERSASNRNINIEVNIGQRLPPRVRARPLPRDIVRIVPQYRGYQYTVVEDEIVIVHPRTREVVEVIREPGSARTTSRADRERIVITREQRETLRQAARRMTTAQTSGSASVSEASCLTLQRVPEELVRANPEFGSYRYLAIGEQVILVDPSRQQIVEVID